MTGRYWIAMIGAFVGSALYAQDITGDWHGTLNAGGAELRLALHISKGANGGLAATLDSIDQGANGISVTSATLHGSNLKLVVDTIHATYEGQVNAEASSIKGT